MSDGRKLTADWSLPADCIAPLPVRRRRPVTLEDVLLYELEQREWGRRSRDAMWFARVRNGRHIDREDTPW